MRMINSRALMFLGVIAFLVSAAIAAGLWLPINANQSSTIIPVKYNDTLIRYSVTFKNLSNVSVHSAAAKLFSVANIRGQSIKNTLVSFGEYSQSKEDDYNFIVLSGMHYPPFGELQVIVSSRVDIPLHNYSHSLEKTVNYKADGYYLSLESREVSIVSDVLSKSQLGTPAGVYGWVINNLEYSGYIQEDRGTLYALQKRRGDCTEFMYLMMSLLRKMGIPARGFAGFYLNQGNHTILSAKDYHNWVEFYDGREWKIMDPLNNNFAEQYDRYIAFRELDGRHEVSGLSSQRFISHDTRLSVEMR